MGFMRSLRTSLSGRMSTTFFFLFSSRVDGDTSVPPRSDSDSDVRDDSRESGVDRYWWDRGLPSRRESVLRLSDLEATSSS